MFPRKVDSLPGRPRSMVNSISSPVKCNSQVRELEECIWKPKVQRVDKNEDIDQSTTVALSCNTYSHLLLMFPEKIQRYSGHQGGEWEAPLHLRRFTQPLLCRPGMTVRIVA